MEGRSQAHVGKVGTGRSEGDVLLSDWSETVSAGIVGRQPGHEVPMLRSGSLEEALVEYERVSLFEREWPLVMKVHATFPGGGAREWIALDQDWGRECPQDAWMEASRRVGYRQLARLRPLTDWKAIGRYLDAVERGQASAWHPIVYGIFLGVFQLPLGPGLLQYARHGVQAWLRMQVGQHAALTEGDLGKGGSGAGNGPAGNPPPSGRWSGMAVGVDWEGLAEGSGERCARHCSQLLALRARDGFRGVA